MHLVDSLKSFNLFSFHAIDLLEKLVFVPPVDKNGFWWKKDHWIGDKVTHAQGPAVTVIISLTLGYRVDLSESQNKSIQPSCL